MMNDELLLNAIIINHGLRYQKFSPTKYTHPTNVCINFCQKKKKTHTYYNNILRLGYWKL